MISRRLFLTLALSTLVVSTTVACQQGKSRDNRRRIGRTVRGPISYDRAGNPVPFQSANYNTLWGEITPAYDLNSFQNELFYFTLPMLESQPAQDQLGYVNAQPGSMAVAFWGEVRVPGGYGQVDRNSRLHIEIYDDRVGQIGSDGMPLPPTVVHIGPDQEGFVSASGTVQSNRVDLRFEDRFGLVQMVGVIQGQDLVGEIYYSNRSASQRSLGRFRVPANGFFMR